MLNWSSGSTNLLVEAILPGNMSFKILGSHTERNFLGLERGTGVNLGLKMNVVNCGKVRMSLAGSKKNLRALTLSVEENSAIASECSSGDPIDPGVHQEVGGHVPVRGPTIQQLVKWLECP